MMPAFIPLDFAALVSIDENDQVDDLALYYYSHSDSEPEERLTEKEAYTKLRRITTSDQEECYFTDENRLHCFVQSE